MSSISEDALGAHHDSLLWTLEEIGRLASASGDPSETLSNVVDLIQRRFKTNVCSVYLLEPDRASLVLAATIGLRPDSIGRVRMRLSEGLVGLVAEQLCAQVVADAPSHPRFKFFEEAGEDRYHSFLGVPIIDRGVLQGVLVIQTLEPRSFSADDVRMLNTAGMQVSSVVSEARTLGQFAASAHQRLAMLARNMWWCWDRDTTSLFAKSTRFDGRPSATIPSSCSSRSPSTSSKSAPRSSACTAASTTRTGGCRSISSRGTPGAPSTQASSGPGRSRYFSAEFGLHESLPIYSGGLGILAGDHIKSASDLGIPLVGVGLFYDQGYFRQYLDRDGWQHEDYFRLDHRLLPLQPAARNGAPVTVWVETRTGTITARVWQLDVGRNRLLLLDSDVEGNLPEDRQLTARLYGGDDRVRIRQELLLGVGGIRALAALGIAPGVLHLNEGHSAFAPLELVRQHMETEGADVREAIRRVARQVVFTTHTPVPAGHDRFPGRLVEEHLGPLRESLGLDHARFMALGRQNPADEHEGFCMTILALKLSRQANAVSSLHGHVSREMWAPLFPDCSEDRVPIGHITNGVHVPTWLAPQMRRLYDRHLGPDWPQRASDLAFWDQVEDIDDGELWEIHQTLKKQLIDSVRRRAARQAERRNEPPQAIAQMRRVLSFDALTIGFARRFATYKRATLFLQDLDAIAALVNNPKMPVQLVFAGKSHPHDHPGKHMLQQVAQLTRDPAFAGKLVFVEDYDINVGRDLVQGVDVWLNNPRRPLEACGTSGQKVVLNGGLNVSVLDGWWAEAYDGFNGFAIGQGETHRVTDVHDRRDGDSLLRVLTEEVVPIYYSRDQDGLPRAWIARVKRAIRTLGWRFSADRMVMDYVQHAYIPAAGGTSSRF